MICWSILDVGGVNDIKVLINWLQYSNYVMIFRLYSYTHTHTHNVVDKLLCFTLNFIILFFFFGRGFHIDVWGNVERCTYAYLKICLTIAAWFFEHLLKLNKHHILSFSGMLYMRTLSWLLLQSKLFKKNYIFFH